MVTFSKAAAGKKPRTCQTRCFGPERRLRAPNQNEVLVRPNYRHLSIWTDWEGTIPPILK